jgi:polysaccharide pyruvyl transferase WcaK-like protein
LTPRTLHGRDGDAQTHYNVKTQEDYDREISCFVAAVDWLWENGYQPIFIPMNTVAPDDDRIACRRIINESKHGINALLVDEEVRPRIAPSLYRECKVSFVARVHGSITSMVGNCPMMMYSFAPKHSGIMNAMGLSEYILEEKSADSEAAVQLLQRLVDNEYDLRRYMDGQLVKLRKDAQIPAVLVADILGVQSNIRI